MPKLSKREPAPRVVELTLGLAELAVLQKYHLRECSRLRRMRDDPALPPRTGVARGIRLLCMEQIAAHTARALQIAALLNHAMEGQPR